MSGIARKSKCEQIVRYKTENKMAGLKDAPHIRSVLSVVSAWPRVSWLSVVHDVLNHWGLSVTGCLAWEMGWKDFETKRNGRHIARKMNIDLPLDRAR